MAYCLIGDVNVILAPKKRRAGNKVGDGELKDFYECIT